MTLTTWEAEPLPQVRPGQAVVRLPPLDELLECWPLVSSLLRKATVRTGCYEPIDLLRMAMAGQVGIWVCEVGDSVVAAIATEVKQYPRRRVLEMLFCGGSRMREWLPVAIATFDEHAHQCGCSHLAVAGRKGWIRSWGGEETGDLVIVRDVKG